MAESIPTVVIGGYLGAGKTTLVNRLLRGASGRRIAVLVNDFGAIGIDADLVESRDGEVLNLAGGCVCCSFGSDLVGALLELPKRDPRPDVILIETSGVALPRSVARSARLAQGIDVEGVVVLADAETVMRQATDAYVGDTVSQQLREADLLVVNKVDLVSTQARDRLRRELTQLAPEARLIETTEAMLEPDVVLGFRTESIGTADRSVAAGRVRATPGETPNPDGLRRLGDPPGSRRASDLFASASFLMPQPVDAHALARNLVDPETGVLRAKGILHDASGQVVVLQTVGARYRVVPAAGGTPASDRAGRLFIIGLRGRLDLPTLERLLGKPIDPSLPGKP